MRSYVSIHISVIFGVAALLTGAIWAKASWGKWWVWDEPTLVSFLIVFLLYCTYYPLRYAIEDRERQARYASVFAITAGAFVPLNFIAVRLAETLVHPRVFATSEGGLPPKMMVTFLVCFAGHGAALGDAGPVRARGEVVAGADRPPAPGARGRRRRRRPARGSRRVPREAGCRLMPALPLDEAGKYVAGAYVVFLALLLIYVAIMAVRLQRIDRELASSPSSAELGATRTLGRTAATRGAREAERGGAMAELLALGVSHKTAPLELRERMALTEGRAVGHARRAASSATRSSRRRRSRPATGPSSTSTPPTRSAPSRSRSACSRARPRSSRPSSSATSTRCGPRRPPSICSGSPPGSTR